MKQSPQRIKRNRAATFLLYPIVAVTWFFGWSLYWIGSRKKPDKSKEKAVQENVTFTVPIPQENYVTQHEDHETAKNAKLHPKLFSAKSS